jgi:hypothetical protein
MAAGKQPYRILYMHGLESGAWGNKAMLLKKSFRTVKSVDMKVDIGARVRLGCKADLKPM